MLTSIKNYITSPNVREELHSIAVTFLTVFLAILSSGIASTNFSREALLSLAVSALRSAVKAVYEVVVKKYSEPAKTV